MEVEFTVKDDMGLPLDINGVYTPGSIRISFMSAYIPIGGSTYISYAINSDDQATSDRDGTLTEIEIGHYHYLFGTVLPEGYDTGATHSIGYYSERNLEDYGLGAPMDDGVLTWVPDGSEVVDVRDVVTDAACAQCHDPLRLHGRRQSINLCVMCHYPGVIDPDSGNTVDFSVMVHKIHRGADLPSVQAGNPYFIVGYRGSIHDYSEVVLPQDIRNCDTCHEDGASQHERYFLNPTRESCGSCHDDVNFASGENHIGGPQISDNLCSACHFPEGELEFDSSVKGAHTIPMKSKQLEGIQIEILDISGTGPGEKPTVLYSLKNSAGEVIDPSTLPFFNFVMAGPTDDYSLVVSERAVEASVPASVDGDDSTAGQFTYSFNASIPEDAEGSFAMGADIFRNVLLNPGTTKEFEHRETAENPLVFFAVTDEEAVPRRQVVSDEKCEECHENLALHGTIRHDADGYCQLCHNPLADDSPFRPEEELPARSIDFKILIHRIHMGVGLENDYTQIGFMGTPHNYNHVVYPGDLRNCAKCHVDDSWMEAKGNLDTVTLREFFSPMPPNTTACAGCHDSKSTAAHAYQNIAPFGEACMACHGDGKQFSVGNSHAR
jgi:OmcA/MtrC family decaheme c-type cytochrome